MPDTMNPIRIYAIFVRQVFLLRRNWTRFVNIFFWVAIDIVLWGFLTKYLNSVQFARLDFVAIILGALILWDFMIRIQQGLMVAFFEDMWTQNFLNLFASPLSMEEYLLGLILTCTATGALAFAVMLIFAGLAFGYSIFTLGISALPFLFILYIFGIALGIFVIGIVLRFGPSAEWFAWPIPMVIAPLAGVYYPVTTLPVPLQWLASVLPPTYVFEGMRAVISGKGLSLHNLILGGTLTLVSLGLATLFFSVIFRYVIRNGLITRFGAENG